MKKPNLFDHATSELSQDAFLIWLMSWCTCDGEGLQKLSQSFIKDLLKKCGHKVDNVHSIKITKQEHDIDILAVVNDEFVIIIEDKTYTDQSNHQLDKYREYVEQRWSDETIIPIYFKLIPQDDLKPVADKKFKIYGYEDFVSLLSNYKHIESDILKDYYNYLLSFDFEKVQQECWSVANCLFFFNKLIGDFDDGYFINYHNQNIRLEWKWIGHDYITLKWNTVKKSFDLMFTMYSDEQTKTQFGDRFEKRVEYLSNRETQLDILKIAKSGYAKYKMVVKLDDSKYIIFEKNGINYEKTKKRLVDLTNQFVEMTKFVQSK